MLMRQRLLQWQNGEMPMARTVMLRGNWQPFLAYTLCTMVDIFVRFWMLDSTKASASCLSFHCISVL